jgi:hypothetical protein
MRTRKTMIPGIKLVLMIGAQWLASGTASAALFAQYSFEETTGTAPVDSTGNTTAAILGAGGLTRDTVNFREGSSSLHFNGAISSSVVQVGNTSNPLRGLMGDGAPVGNPAHWDATIMYWMRSDTINPGESTQRVVESRWGNTRLIMRGDAGAGDGDGMRLELNDGYRGNPGDTASAGIFDGQWHHIAMVIDQADDGSSTEGLTFYLDGVSQPLFNAAGPANFAMGPGAEFGLGGYNLADGRTGGFYAGNLDDFRIYRGDLLSQAEIQAAMIPEPSAVAFLGLVLGGLMLRRRK